MIWCWIYKNRQNTKHEIAKLIVHKCITFLLYLFNVLFKQKISIDEVQITTFDINLDLSSAITMAYLLFLLLCCWSVFCIKQSSNGSYKTRDKTLGSYYKNKANTLAGAHAVKYINWRQRTLYFILWVRLHLQSYCFYLMFWNITMTVMEDGSESCQIWRFYMKVLSLPVPNKLSRLRSEEECNVSEYLFCSYEEIKAKTGGGGGS